MSKIEEGFQVCTVDTETTIDEEYGPKPQYPGNRVVYYGLKVNDSPYKHSSDGILSVNPDGIKKDSQTVLQGHNLKFDLLYFLKENPNLIHDMIYHNVMAWDTQIAEYLLSGQTRLFYSLEETAAAHGVPFTKDTTVKEMFEMGLGADKIDPEILLPYLEEDVLTTHEVGRLQRISKHFKRCPNLYINQMDALLAITEIEHNGMALDSALLHRMSSDCNAEIIVDEVFIEGYFKDKFKQMFHANVVDRPNYTSNKTLSAILFGGTLQYTTLESLLDPHGNQVYFKSGKNKGLPRTRKVVHDVSIEPKISPEEVGSSETKITGVYTFDDSILNTLNIKLHPIKYSQERIYISAIINHRKVSKLYNTYILPLINDSINNIIYGQINQCSTTTGRYSSSNPNLQNMPSSDDSELKRVFVSRWGDDGVIMEADYKQLEVIALALLSGCLYLQNDIKSGVDIHDKTGSRVFSLPMTHDQRRVVKSINFGLIYGGAARGLAENAGIEVNVAINLISSFYSAYPGVEIWHKYYRKSALEHGVKYLSSKSLENGHPQHIWQANSITGRVFSYRGYINNWGPMRLQREEPSSTEMKNYPVQGLATGDIVPMMLAKLLKAIVFSGMYDKIKLINTVHDSIILDVHKSVLKDAAHLVKNILEDVPKALKDNYDIETDLPFRVEIKVGPNWKDTKEFDFNK